MAASADVPFSVRNPEFDFRNNVVGTLNMLEVSRLKKVKRFIFPSSACVYDPNQRPPFSECDIINAFSSPYAVSKLTGEAYCRCYSSCYGIDSVIARMFNVYGPRARRFVIYDIIKKFRQNKKFIELFGDGLQLRDFIYVSDAARGLILLAEKGTPAGIYNLASGRGTGIKELALMIRDLLGARTKIRFTGTLRPGDVYRWYADIGKIKNIGFRQKVSLEEGLRLAINSIT